MSSKIKVYSPDGVCEEHTYANARDLTTLCGWSFTSLKAAKVQAEETKANAPKTTKLKKTVEEKVATEKLIELGKKEAADRQKREDEKRKADAALATKPSKDK